FIYYGGIFDWDRALNRLEELNTQAESPDLWNNQALAQKLLKERETLSTSILRIKQLQTDLSDNVELLDLAEAEGDLAHIEEAEKQIEELSKTASRLQLQT